jgi:hypothetical protein
MFSFISRRKNEIKIEGNTIHTVGVLTTNPRYNKKNRENPYAIEISYPLKSITLHFETKERRDNAYILLLKELNKPI